MSTTQDTHQADARVTLSPEQVDGVARRVLRDRVPIAEVRAQAAGEPRTEACGLTSCDACPTARAACCRAVSRVAQGVLIAAGVLAVAVGTVGIFVPGLPTTVFLIIAVWCFCRSCPPLERWLVRQPLFRPYAAFIDGKTPMPPRAVKVSIASIWIASLASIGLITLAGDGGAPWWVPASIAIAAAVGTVAVLRVAKRSRRTLVAA